MEIPVAAPKALLADKGYDGDRFRESLLLRGILPIIPPRSNRKVPEHPDYRRYRDRNRIERMFAKLKQQRRIATRYDKTILSFESFLNLAAGDKLTRADLFTSILGSSPADHNHLIVDACRSEQFVLGRGEWKNDRGPSDYGDDVREYLDGNQKALTNEELVGRAPGRGLADRASRRMCVAVRQRTGREDR